MNTVFRNVLSVMLVAAGVGGFIWMGTPEVTTQPPRPAAPEQVQLAIAEEHNDGIQFDVDGVVVPFRQIQIAAQVSGRIVYKADACRVGRAVREGELLLRIEQDDYDIEVKLLTEELAQADAMLEELAAEITTADNQIRSAEEQLAIDIRQLTRSQDLLERGVSSDAEVDDVRKAEVNARNQWQTLLDQKNLLIKRRVRLESARSLQEANLAKAQLALERTEIRAPMDGVVVNENVEQDGFVQAGSTVISLQDTSRLDVACKLYMRQMNWLWQADTHGQGTAPPDHDLLHAYDFPDTPAEVIYQLGGTTYRWTGVVDRYDGAGLDSQTRMVPCRVHVNDPLSVQFSQQGTTVYQHSKPPTLMTGMFVKVRIDARPPIPLVRLPQTAIQPGDKIWTVVDGKLKQKDILIATADENSVIAYQQVGGLQAGDAVVISPLATPMDGLPVRELGKDSGIAERPIDHRGSSERQGSSERRGSGGSRENGPGSAQSLRDGTQSSLSRRADP